MLKCLLLKIMQWATLNSCLSTHLCIYPCIRHPSLHCVPSAQEFKGPGQSGKQPATTRSQCCSFWTPTLGSPGGAPVTLSISLCSQRGQCSDSEGAGAPEHGSPGPLELYSLQAVEGEINSPAFGPLAAVGVGRQLCCSRALSRSPREWTWRARWCPLDRPLTGCRQPSTPGYTSSLSACSWGLFPMPDPVPHPGLPVCLEDISDTTHPLPVSSGAAQSDKHQDGHPETPEGAAGELWTACCGGTWGESLSTLCSQQSRPCLPWTDSASGDPEQAWSPIHLRPAPGTNLSA